MPVCLKGRGHSRAVQASRTTAVFLACLLAGCADPLAAPVDLFHDLEGGEIAAQRPPPPGAGLPYPQLGSVPAQPTLPNPAYRNGLQAQLTAERDRTERTAADTKLATLPPPPAAAPPPPPAAAPPAAASLDTAEVAATTGARCPPALPPPPTALVIEGAPAFIAGVPDMPAAPPPPAAFEGVPAEPLPTAPHPAGRPSRHATRHACLFCRRIRCPARLPDPGRCVTSSATAATSPSPSPG